jgi:hypothetical protein
MVQMGNTIFLTISYSTLTQGVSRKNWLGPEPRDIFKRLSWHNVELQYHRDISS